MGGEQLLAEWYEERGPRASRLNPEQEAAMARNLRGRQEELDNPKPLEWCPTCQVNTRGAHQYGHGVKQ